MTPMSLKIILGGPRKIKTSLRRPTLKRRKGRGPASPFPRTRGRVSSAPKLQMIGWGVSFRNSWNSPKCGIRIWF